MDHWVWRRIAGFAQLDNRVADSNGSVTERRRRAYYCVARFLSAVPAPGTRHQKRLCLITYKS
jgi:hypothetical protein